MTGSSPDSWPQLQKVIGLMRASSDQGRQMTGLVRALRPGMTLGDPTSGQRAAQPPPDSTMSGGVPSSAFAELIATLSAEQKKRDEPRHYAAPPSRFMVREVKVGRAHRSTKRNYDYFEDLNAALERQRSERSRKQSET